MADSPLLAVALLILAFLVLVALFVVVLLAIEHGRELRAFGARQDTFGERQEELARRIDKRLATDRACVLRDMTHGPEKNDVA